jgi:hypothetical protein
LLVLLKGRRFFPANHLGNLYPSRTVCIDSCGALDITREPQRNLSVLHVFGQTAAENPHADSDGED